MIFTRLILAVSAVSIAPFPNGSASDASQVSTEGAAGGAGALEYSKESGGAAVDSLKNLWSLFVSSDGVYWVSLLNGIRPLLVIGFFFWAGQTIYKWNFESKRFPWDTTVPLLLSVVLLYNNAIALSALEQAMAAVPNKITAAILDTAVKGVTGRQKIQQVAARNAYNQAFREKAGQCTSEKDYAACIAQAKDDAQKASEQILPTGSPKETEGDNIFSSLGKKLFSGIKMGMIAAIIGVLTTLSYTSHLVLGLVQVLWASLGLVFAGMNLIPNAPNLKVFFSGFIGISLAMVFNAAFQVAAALMMATAGDLDPLVMPLLVGLFGTIFSCLIAYLGISGAYAGIGVISSGAARLVRR